MIGGTGRLVVLMALAWLAGCTAGAEGSCTLALATAVPLKLVLNDSKLAVPVTVKGAGTMLFLDTGATTTFLDHSYTQVGDIPGLVSIGGVAGSSTGSIRQFNAVQLGRLRSTINAVDGRIGPGLRKIGIDGLLGMDVVGNYDADLDLAGGELRLYQAQGSGRTPPVAMDGTLYSVGLIESGNDRRPHVLVTIGGNSYPAVVDTGAESSMMSDWTVRRLGLIGDAVRNDPTIDMSGVGPGRIKVRKHVLDSLTIGDLTLHNVPVALSPKPLGPHTDMLLGLEVAKRLHLWISQSSQSLVMQYPPRPSPALPPATQ